MKKFFEKIKYNIQGLMQGRYGIDELSKVIMILCLLILLISSNKKFGFLYFISLALIVWVYIRCFSKNFAKRMKERETYLKIKRKFLKEINFIKDCFKLRKTHICFKCKNCKTPLRVPKGKGKIEVTCPKCKEKIIKNT